MITGSLVALVTPMKPNGEVDWVGLTALIDFHLSNGTDGIVAMGTTGECSTLSVQEHCEVVREVVARVGGRIPVIAGTGANSTREAIYLTREAANTGVDACLVVTPYYNKPTQEGLYLHYKAIAAAVDVDLILYNVPGRTAVDMLPETVERLADIENITGIKEATGDMERARQLIVSCGDRLAIYSGDDATAAEMMLLGGQGDISVTANVAPAQMHELCLAAMTGDEEKARALNEPLISLHEKLFVEANPIPVKWALREMGLIDAGIRLPLTQLSKSLQSVVRQALADARLLR